MKQCSSQQNASHFPFQGFPQAIPDARAGKIAIAMPTLDDAIRLLLRPDHFDFTVNPLGGGLSRNTLRAAAPALADNDSAQ